MAKAKKTTVKTKKKKWFQVAAPKAFQEQIIGECPAFEINGLVGKKLTVNLMALTRDPRKQGMEVTFTIIGIKGDKAVTEVTGHKILPAAIKRKIRRNKDRIDLIIKVRTVDGSEVVIKPLIVTRNLTRGSVKRALYRETRAYVINQVSKMTYDKAVTEIVNWTLQKRLYDRLKKVNPVAVCALRDFKLLSRDEDAAREQKEKASDAQKGKESQAEEKKKDSDAKGEKEEKTKKTVKPEKEEKPEKKKEDKAKEEEPKKDKKHKKAKEEGE